MINQLYILVIILVTIVVIIFYYNQQISYRAEIERIKKLEDKYQKENDEIDFIRKQSMACPYGDFKTPRSCYFDSDYACSWNDLAKRCDAKK